MLEMMKIIGFGEIHRDVALGILAAGAPIAR